MQQSCPYNVWPCRRSPTQNRNCYLACWTSSTTISAKLSNLILIRSQELTSMQKTTTHRSIYRQTGSQYRIGFTPSNSSAWLTVAPAAKNSVCLRFVHISLVLKAHTPGNKFSTSGARAVGNMRNTGNIRNLKRQAISATPPSLRKFVFFNEHWHHALSTCGLNSRNKFHFRPKEKIFARKK